MNKTLQRINKAVVITILFLLLAGLYTALVYLRIHVKATPINNSTRAFDERNAWESFPWSLSHRSTTEPAIIINLTENNGFLFHRQHGPF